MMTGKSGTVARCITIAIAFGALASTSACIHVSQRVWQNGQAMQSTWQYRAMLNGDVNPTVFRGMYWSSNALSLGQRSLPYQPFGRW